MVQERDARAGDEVYRFKTTEVVDDLVDRQVALPARKRRAEPMGCRSQPLELK
jgi:hypothetical protein